LNPLKTLLGNINTAIRVNLAAISRVDKSVLDTGAQIKGVVYEGNQKLGIEFEALDEGLHDLGTRIRGISEYDLPRVEEEIKSHVRVSKRQNDSLTVIGGRIIGTQNKFDEMVDALYSRSENGAESPGKIVGHARGFHSMGRRAENPLLKGGSRSFRGYSSATRSSSNASASRLIERAFEEKS
jgi:hypothetical protein